MKAAEEKLKAKQAKLEAERLAKEEEDRLVAGMDELDALLYRQNLRVQVKMYMKCTLPRGWLMCLGVEGAGQHLLDSTKIRFGKIPWR